MSIRKNTPRPFAAIFTATDATGVVRFPVRECYETFGEASDAFDELCATPNVLRARLVSGDVAHATYVRGEEANQ